LKLGERLKAIRKSRNLTLEKIHERSGISMANLSKWENNKGFPTLKSLEKWAKAVGITLWDIFFDYPDEFTPTAEELELIGLFRQLAKKDQEHILAILKQISKKS